MAQQNPPPGAAPPGQQQQKLTKEQKKALAEQQKRIQQEKMRALELNKLVANLSKELASSVIDTPMMYKLGANRLKLMLKADHCSVALFEEYPNLGKICIIRQQSNIPPNKEKIRAEEEAKKKAKAAIAAAKAARQPPPPAAVALLESLKNKGKKSDDDKKEPVPVPPPKEPPKPGIIPDLDGVFIHTLQVVEQIRTSNKPIMIPDVSKFPDKAVQQFATWYGIKSLLFLPVMVHGEVVGIITIYALNNPQAFSQNELIHSQKAVEALTKSVETAPPVLPDNLKDNVISKINKDDNSHNIIEYYSRFLDDVFEFMIGELKGEEAQELVELQEEQSKTDNPLRKVWYQLGKMVGFTEQPDMAYLCHIGIKELVSQAVEYAKSKKGSPPTGIEELSKIMTEKLKLPEILSDPNAPPERAEAEEDSPSGKYQMVGGELLVSETIDDEDFDEEEILEEVDKEIHDAVRGFLLFSDEKRVTLINDVEQSEMLNNFVAVTAAADFRQHIRASMENIPDIPEEVDTDISLAQLSHMGMREISFVVAQNMAEKYLYEIEGFLEMPEEKQKEQMDNLQKYIHLKIMANLTPTLRGKLSVWQKLMEEKVKKKAERAAKQRAVLVGRMVNIEEDEEDEDWDDEDDEDED